MVDVYITALFTSFFLVRLVKGSWTRNPAYVALSIFGGMAGLILLMKLSPGAEGSLIYGNFAALGGALTAILIYDQAMS
ncbi:MAG: hypothetical protein GC184_02895 [Rhizobiales bacterium]|nr:hypothetical protein [Hyphomicrobiales bacterium]